MFFLQELSGGPPFQVNGYQSVSLNGEIYAFPFIYLDDDLKVSVLNPEKLLWRHHHMTSSYLELNKTQHKFVFDVVTYGGLIYLFIKMLWENSEQALAYNPESHILTKLHVGGVWPSHCPYPHGNYSSCIVGDLLYAYTNGFMFTFSFLTHQWSCVKTSGPKPLSFTPRYSLLCISLGFKMYLWGYRYMYAFDTRNNSFEVIDARGDIPTGMGRHSMFLYDGKIFVFVGIDYDTVDDADEDIFLSKDEYMPQFFCFDTVSRVWRRCNPFGSLSLFSSPNFQALACPCFEVMGSYAICFSVADFARDPSAWFVFDLELTLKGFCVQELMKSKDLDVSKLPPGLRRNFIQQDDGYKKTEDTPGSYNVAEHYSCCSVM